MQPVSLGLFSARRAVFGHLFFSYGLHLEDAGSWSTVTPRQTSQLQEFTL